MRISFFLMAILTLTSCSENHSEKYLGLKSTAIINGKNVREKDTVAASIVGIIDTRTNYLCTGTLIAENIVLTAAHCIPNQVSNIKVVFSTDVDDILNTLEPDVLEEFALNATDFKKGPNGSDIALLKFKGALPLNYKPAVFLSNKSEITPGVIATVAGFGVNHVATEKRDSKNFQELLGLIASGEVACDEQDNGEFTNCVKLSATGDGILRVTTAPVLLLDKTEVQLDEKKSGTCNGDSGGPAFINKNGSFFLFGVTSRGSARCNDIGVYTNALDFTDWIKQTSLLLK